MRKKSFSSIADKLEMGNMNLVGRILTRNRKAPRIGHLQDEETTAQDEWSARKANWTLNGRNSS
ncbi:hypothetical protein DYL72_06840 [Vibrio anguillarum]|uniref:Uncharacterized protein n=1 Tax=Vibrio anguillarum TaxID=55601 RepID=A0A7U6FPJ3_VIBAN|nr:hypothetical protein DYL72_06840 [Vibrio anguillarum]